MILPACCPRPATGHAAVAAPSSEMNSRRLFDRIAFGPLPNRAGSEDIELARISQEVTATPTGARPSLKCRLHCWLTNRTKSPATIASATTRPRTNETSGCRLGFFRPSSPMPNQKRRLPIDAPHRLGGRKDQAVASAAIATSQGGQHSRR